MTFKRWKTKQESGSQRAFGARVRISISAKNIEISKWIFYNYFRLYESPLCGTRKNHRAVRMLDFFDRSSQRPPSCIRHRRRRGALPAPSALASESLFPHKKITEYP